MSYVFEVDDTTVWSPGLRVGALYVSMAECLATWAGVPSGLAPMASDYYIVDIEVFKAFVQAVLKDPSFGHPVLGELARGIIATSLVMLSRAAVPLPEIGPGAEPLTELVTALATKMPA